MTKDKILMTELKTWLEKGIEYFELNKSSEERVIAYKNVIAKINDLLKK
jgi:hypothetical protein